MSGPERLSLDLVFDVREPSKTWWRDGRIGKVLGEALEETDLWLDFAFHGVEGGRMARLRSAKELEALSRKWKPGGYSLQPAAEEDPDAPSLTVSIREGVFWVALVVAGAALERRRTTLLRSLADLGRRLFEALRPIADLSLGSTAPDEPYPRPRPPGRLTLGFTPGSVLDLFDQDHLRAKATRRQLDAVLKAPLPRGARRTREGRLVIIQWLRDVVDAEAVGAARSRQEQWLLAKIGIDLDPSYNDAGDLLEAVDAQEHPQLTFYDPSNEVGYKAVVPSALDDVQWAELEGWARRGKLPDGTRLQHLRLIVPKRALALKLLPRARKAGADAVLYLDDQGQWWNPSPPGLWLDA